MADVANRIVCGKDGCEVATTGVCAEGQTPPQACPFFGKETLEDAATDDDLQTNKELTETIFVLPLPVNTTAQSLAVSALSLAQSKADAASGLSSQKKKILNEITGMVVYESNSEKAKKLLPYLLVAGFGLLSVITIVAQFKKKIL